MARRRSGGSREVTLHADAARLLAEADYPARVKQTILLALRGGKPGKQQCLICRKAAQHCQFWVPSGLVQAMPDPTARPAVYWLCEAHHGQVSEAEIVARLTRPGRGREGSR
jgi:hypothetical protein